MLQMLFLFPCLDTVCLSEPLAQAENSLAGILLEFRRIVKGASDIDGILTLLRQGGIFEEPAGRVSRFVADFGFFVAGTRFTFELFGRA
jgi:hypothetical protein